MEKGPGRISPAAEAAGLSIINTSDTSNLVMTAEDNEET